MNLITIIGIAVGLSMDAFAVSVANGCIIKGLKIKNALLIAFSFGFFQFLMPVFGWAAGNTFKSYIQNFDHWIVFGLLGLIGGKMIYESLKANRNCKSKNCLHLPTLLLLSIATSIDALAAGVSFSLVNVNIILPVVMIGVITFILCLIGIYIGNNIGNFIEDKLELAGGIILILIGVKVLIEHLHYNT